MIYLYTIIVINANGTISTVVSEHALFCSAGRKELGAAGADADWLCMCDLDSSYAPLPSLSSSSSSDGKVCCFNASARGITLKLPSNSDVSVETVEFPETSVATVIAL